MASKTKLRDLIFKDPRMTLAAISLLCVMTEGAFTTIAAVVFFSVSVVMTVKYYGRMLHIAINYWYLFLFPLYCMASTLWSDDPALTLRYSLELLFTFAMALMIGRTLNAVTALIVTFTAGTYLIFLSLPQVPEVLSGQSSLAGVFESKNPMGSLCHLEFVASLVLVFGVKMPMVLRVGAMGMIALSMALLPLTRSAGADVAVGISIAVLLIGALYMATPNRFKALSLFVAGLLSLLTLLALPLIRAWWSEFQQDVLHKDTTLTGRTELWDFAGRLIRERPWLGNGVGSFWREGNIDAEGLWRMYQIPGRHGFNFHNTFIEMTVGGGYIGVALFILTFGGLALTLILGFFRNPTPPKLFFLAYFAAWYARLPTEVLIGPFSGIMMLIIASVFYANERPERRSRAAPAVPTPTSASPPMAPAWAGAITGNERPLLPMPAPAPIGQGS